MRVKHILLSPKLFYGKVYNMRRFYILVLIICCVSLKAHAVVKTTNWTGFGSGLLGGTDVNNWFNSSNWDNGVPVAGDVAQIGVAAAYTNPPILSTSTSIGTLNLGMFNTTSSFLITSGITLTVTGDINMQYRQYYNVSTQFNIGNGTGLIKCNGSVYVGNTQVPPNPTALFGAINSTNVLTVNLNLQSFTIDQNLSLYTASSAPVSSGSVTSINVNNPILNVVNGSLIVTGNIATLNQGGHTGYPGFSATFLGLTLATYPAVTPLAQLIVNPSASVSGNNTTLSLGGTLSIFSGDVIDLYGPGTATTCTTIYAGNTSQPIYSSSLSGLDASPTIYSNLTTSGAGPKSLQAGNVTIAGNWSSAGASTGVVTAATGNTTYFQGTVAKSPQLLNDAVGVTFNNVNFQTAGAARTMQSGNFSVTSTSILTVDSAVTLNANGYLTLLSTAAGSATVATLRHNAAINGNVNVQRFIQGGLNIAKRGYRALSSPVYTATRSGINCFDFNYLLNSAFVSGAAGGGFNTTSTNPSLYLFREDVSASSTSFTGGNWKGIALINPSASANYYDTGTQKRTTTANTADTTINLGVGNAFLFYFRGNKTNNGTTSGTKTTAPFNYPEDVTFTQTGALNTGVINVAQWYKSASGFSYTNASNVSNASQRGLIFVGNPYASTINFEKFNRQGNKSSIYISGLPAASVAPGKIWIYNETKKQYQAYIQSSNASYSAADTISNINPSGSIAQDAASNMIAAGQGFFMRVTAPGSTLVFKETAKTTTQPVAANVNAVMSAPANNILAFSSAAQPVNQAAAFSLIRLELAKDTINNDEAILVMNNSTSSAFDDNMDAEDMNGNGALVSLSVMSSDNVATSIKRVKFPQAGAQKMGLRVDATASGTYHLHLKNMDNMPATYNVWLIDSLMNDSLDLKHNNNYDFAIDKNNPNSYGYHRFSIVVRQNPAAMMHTLSFAINKTIQGAQLTWFTENEGTNFDFLIEKSTDGKTFNQIGVVSSNGSGNYAYTDITPGKGMNYYRVKLQDKVLNALSYSNVLSLNYADAATTTIGSNVSVYPNPATSTVNIKMAAGSDELVDINSYRVSISNSTGKVVKQITTTSPTVQTDVTQFMPGTYMIQVVKVSDNKLQGQSKFVKL